MKNRIVLLLFLALACMANSIVHAGNIKGKVVDGNTGEPMEFVNVTVRPVGSDKALPQGVVTNEKGDFIITNVPAGKYIVKLSYIGYVAALKNVALTGKAASADMGEIVLSENENVLSEVEVVGMRSQMRFDLDKKVFNVDQDIAAAGASASEILETIPSVEVDNEGEVSLRGNSSVTIWINGKPSGLSSDNRAQILEQLPAESIEKIEIITNPSARYSPEGTAGIINIVLKQNRQGGYYGSAQAGANTRGGYNVSGSFNYNNSRWDTYGSVGFRRRKNDTNNDSYRTYTDDTFLESKKRGTRDNHNVFLRAGATYYLTQQDHLYITGFGMFGKGNSRSVTNYTSDAPGEFLESINANRMDSKNRGGNVELGYMHKFGESHTLDLSASFNTWHMPRNSLYMQKSEYPDAELPDETYTEESWQRQDSKINSDNWEFQADYVNQFSKAMKLEAGYKGTLGRNNSPVTTYSGPTEEGMVIDPEYYNKFNYRQDIQALYASVGGRFGDFNFQGGLRGEYWHLETKSLGYMQDDKDVKAYTTDKFALFPSAFVSYSLPQGNELQVNYTRRIQRPWGGQLNSFVNISDPTNISYGNPYLQPQYSNSFELNYIKTWDMHMLSLSGYYRSTDNVIQRISFIRNGVMNTTYDNVSKSASTGAELVVKDRFFKILELTTTVNLFYYKLDGFSYLPVDADKPVAGKSQDNLSWNIRAMASVMLPWGISLQVRGGYNAKQITAQGYREPMYRMDAGVKKSFNKWSVSINMRDILNSRSWHGFTNGENFTQESKSWGSGRTANFTVSYSFGNMKAKKNKKEMKEDDMNPQSSSDDQMGEMGE